ncbi:bacillithiol biosynthesis deacetylase BshB2 [Natribacillus halophilus]|uniref:Bacillithiol biosynthesis deacetylase BshB2 n=1 Tax=Natribacillus halophilus TaxID=549003 RepID=A0A1G8Q1K3_9BACI|nr:bacillithiol biosynthesis deacetylase BshB2 [Natribacillus halophilus]SDI98612.1 bacillithiol biosynthesis deacetylase BshB2 [Natribacillus halophilus]
MNQERHILLLFPHPDDETFSAAGTVMMHKKKHGTKVTVASLTLGEMGRNWGNPPVANRETLPLVRREEMANASEVMGVDEIRHLGYRDKTLEFEELDTVAAHLKEVIMDVNPSLVITFYPGLSIHPDHDATGAAVVEAMKRIPENERPKLHTKAIDARSVEEIGEPDIEYDIGDWMDRKLEAIAAHESQMQEVTAITKQKLAEGDEDTEAWIRYEQFWIYEL